MRRAKKEEKQKHGILVRLFKKLVPNHSYASNQHFDYLVWSYFDGINFEKVEDISDFYVGKNPLYPHSTYNRYYEEQHLHLYLSDLVERAHSDEFIWGKKFGGFPLISLTEIKIADKAITKQGLQTLEKEIRETIEKQLFNKEDSITYEVYRALGYGEFVIITKCQSYSLIFDVVAMLRGLNYIWSTYTILGVSKDIEHLNDWDDPFYGMVSIKLTASSMSGIKAIKEKLEAHLKSDSEAAPEIKFNSTFGRYDFEFLIGDGVHPISSRKVIELFHNGPFNSNSAEYHQNILLTNTHWLFMNQSTESMYDSEAFMQMSTTLSEHTAFVATLNQIYEKRLIPFLPETLQVSFRETLYSFERMIQSFYKFSQLYEMKEIIISLLYIMMESLGYTREQICCLLKDESKKIEVIEPDSPLDASHLALVISLIANYMMDMLHSSRSFFEISNQNIKFSGYIAKIIMAYSSIIDTIEIDVEECIRQNGKINAIYSSLCFFLSVNISHEVDSYMLFPNSSNTPAKRLISIRCDTNSLFRIESAICYFMHEIGHFVPPKDRRVRNKVLLRAVCAFSARLFVGSLFSERLVVNDEEFHQQHKLFMKYPEFQKPFEQTVETFQNIIFMLFDDYYSDNLVYDGLLNQFAGFLDTSFFEIFNQEIWEKLKQKHVPFWEQELKKTYKFWLDYITDTQLIKGSAAENELNPDEINEMIEEIIQKISRTFMHENTEKNRIELSKSLMNFMNEFKNQQNIKWCIKTTKNHFSELVADVFMCSVLGLTDMEYKRLVMDYAKRMYGISLQEILQSDEDTDKKEYTSLLSRVLTVLLLCPEEEVIHSEGVDGNDEDFWLSKPVYNRISNYNNVIGMEFIETYLKENLIQFYNINLHSGKWSNIKNLHNAYRVLVTGKHEERFSRQMAFVEKFWEFGLKRQNNEINLSIC